LVDMLEFFKIAHPEAVIYGHRDFASKACPSFDAKKEYSNITNMWK
jgi:N-acetylmuramoyl-L-alanine amidase